VKFNTKSAKSWHRRALARAILKDPRILVLDSESEALIQEAASRCQRTVEGMNLLCIQDTSEINQQRHLGKLSKEDQELGPVGNNRDIGFFIHPMLVLDAQDGFPLGFSDIHIWNRTWEKDTKYTRKYQ
jgi:hypothetical protein